MLDSGPILPSIGKELVGKTNIKEALASTQMPKLHRFSALKNL